MKTTYTLCLFCLLLCPSLAFPQITIGGAKVYTGSQTFQNSIFRLDAIPNKPSEDSVVVKNASGVGWRSGGSFIPDHNDLDGLQGGSPSQYYHLTQAQRDSLNHDINLQTEVYGTLPIISGGTGQTTQTAAFDALAPTTTQGDIIYHNGTDNVRLGKSDTATSYLSNTGTSNNPSWAKVDLTNGVTPAFGGWVLISTASASSSATIDFTGLTSTYKTYILVIEDLIPATNATTLYFRVGTGGTPTYQSGATDYAFVRGLSVSPIGAFATNTFLGTGDGNESYILIGSNAGMSNTANATYNGFIRIYDPAQSSVYHSIDYHCTYIDGTGSPYQLISQFGSGVYLSSTAVTAVRILMNSGNITSGTFKLYGLL